MYILTDNGKCRRPKMQIIRLFTTLSFLMLLSNFAHADEVATIHLGKGSFELDAPKGFVYDPEINTLAWPIVQATTLMATRNYAFFVENIDLEVGDKEPSFIILTPLSYEGTIVQISGAEFSELVATMVADLDASVNRGADLAKELSEDQESLPERVENLGILYQDETNFSVLARQHYRENGNDYSALVAIGMTHVFDRVVRTHVMFPQDSGDAETKIRDTIVTVMQKISSSEIMLSPEESLVEEIGTSGASPEFGSFDRLMESRRSMVSAFWVLAISVVISTIPLFRHFRKKSNPKRKKFATEQEEKLRLKRDTSNQ
jgi:hypothetical protein